MTRKRIEPGIYLQANGTYGVYLLVDGKPRFKTLGRKLSQARRLRNQLQAKAERGELPAPTRLTFAQLAETWLEGFEALVEAGERGERTLENYRYHLDGHLLPALGRRRLQSATSSPGRPSTGPRAGRGSRHTPLPATSRRCHSSRRSYGGTNSPRAT
jgi:integrase